VSKQKTVRSTAVAATSKPHRPASILIIIDIVIILVTGRRVAGARQAFGSTLVQVLGVRLGALVVGRLGEAAGRAAAGGASVALVAKLLLQQQLQHIVGQLGVRAFQLRPVFQGENLETCFFGYKRTLSFSVVHFGIKNHNLKHR